MNSRGMAFFKPTYSKVFIVVLLFIIILIPFFHDTHCTVFVPRVPDTPGAVPCADISYSIASLVYVKYMGIIFYFIDTPYFVDNGHFLFADLQNPWFWVLIAVAVGLLYLISCVLIYFTEKRRYP